MEDLGSAELINDASDPCEFKLHVRCLVMLQGRVSAQTKNMSRLPRLRSSSPDRIHCETGPSLPSRTTSNLKRKAIAEEDEDQPRKLPAVGPAKPLQPSRTGTNTAAAANPRSATLPKALTRPRAPTLTVSRGTSAPPGNSKPYSRSTSSRQNTRTVSGSGPSRIIAGSRSSDDRRFNDLQVQLASMDAARAADTARLASDMEAERNKVAELQANHLALSRELATAKSHELNQRRELIHASDELENIRKKHAMEIMDLEMGMKKRDRELREVAEDLRICRSDLDREREATASLKSTISHQSITLTTHNHALEAQNAALLSQINANAKTISELTLSLESVQNQVDVMKKEAMEGELVRRKLHNMVQELKGNIRVFCRVRPVLSSDLTTYASLSTSSSWESDSGSLEIEKAKEDLQANFTFPDIRDHKEISVQSFSSSATGQERKEVYNFNFDRVCGFVYGHYSSL